MHQAVVQYAERAAEKLRGERQYCRQVATFIRTSPFAVKAPCYINSAVEKLPLPTQDSRDMIPIKSPKDTIWIPNRYTLLFVIFNQMIDFFDQGNNFLTSGRITPMNRLCDSQSSLNDILKLSTGRNTAFHQLQMSE